MILPSVLLLFGLAMVVAPRFFAARSEGARLKRLEQIEQGAPEDYFEERRELTSYAPSQRFFLLWRLWGAAVAIGSAGVLLVRSRVAG